MHIPTLNRWFLFASAFFTLTMVWTVLDDASAEWKDYQREFRAMELEKAEEARAPPSPPRASWSSATPWSRRWPPPRRP